MEFLDNILADNRSGYPATNNNLNKINQNSEKEYNTIKINDADDDKDNVDNDDDNDGDDHNDDDDANDHDDDDANDHDNHDGRELMIYTFIKKILIGSINVNVAMFITQSFNLINTIFK
ncbi:calsequestrin-1-like [Hydra vulgaris]|uniref:calsequestrin-1-like n=1 Tax=Hydra vulgaris TaxID=6087 RepID=UPI0032E9D3CA